MRDSWQERLRVFLIHRIPLAVTFALMFLFCMPINSLQLNYFRPLIGIICVYYWVLKRGYLFGYFSAFCVGLLMDVYSSSPLGINILTMMLIVFITNISARYFQNASFGLGWLLFCIVGLVTLFLKWLFLMFYFKSWLQPQEILFAYCTTIMFYPFVAYLNVWVQNKFLPQERINE